MYINTKYELLGVTSYTSYESGAMKECKVDRHNLIHTPYGDFIPRYQSPDERNRDSKSISFFPDGEVQSIHLEEPALVATSIGSFTAELVTFYENGALNSLLPLNGQIGFGWSEEDESALAQTYDFDLPVGKFSAKIIGLRFFENGNLRSLILWPKENILIRTPLGECSARIGFRLYENGALHSFEPSFPLPVQTPVGEITAFDHLALGADADFNSIRFDPAGRLISVSTNSDIVIKNVQSGQREVFYQQMRFGMAKDAVIKVPVKLFFDQNNTTILENGAETRTFKNQDHKFMALYDGSFKQLKCSPGSDCSGCGAACM